MEHILGTVKETFVIGGVSRVLLLDEDCSEKITAGEYVEVTLQDSTTTRVQIQDALHERGSTYGIEKDKITALRVENVGFPDDGNAVIGSVVTKA